ncbi:hypothetical protein SCLCIDRAFT_774701 [Scleroderma citrinum Foug A]|uniref:Uncharacterized protein n=1 Tax=Scleroderma citrinum Foug A TaxID=1036808 RepID=A0A0C3ADQ7_9AGAM|nr:hypothetical protein SCLCIDRAFT_774701 [Scleroderma citrinum Foug A]
MVWRAKGESEVANRNTPGPCEPRSQTMRHPRWSGPSPVRHPPKLVSSLSRRPSSLRSSAARKPWAPQRTFFAHPPLPGRMVVFCPRYGLASHLPWTGGFSWSPSTQCEGPARPRS